MLNSSPAPDLKIDSSSVSNLRVLDHFSRHGTRLRARFDERFADPLRATSGRFCWDYWTVAEQYQLLRTPAEAFFGQDFKPFLAELLSWSRMNLGCQMISHPWLSVYLDGCHQALHSDVPHGPWSFVYSLTNWNQRIFRGGRTIIAQPKLLRYFNDLDYEHSDENSELFQTVDPKLNRLIVFDPRYPHGVERVDGAQDVRDGRLVIHGWFTEPRPMVEGSLGVARVGKPMDALANRLLSEIGSLDVTGLLSLRLQIARTGAIDGVRVLCGHLVDRMGTSLTRRELTSAIRRSFRDEDVFFPRATGKTTLTLPLEFRK